MKQVNFGLIGCGGAARMLYAPYIPHLKGGKIVAVADPDLARATALADQFGAASYTDLADLLAHPQLDAVMVMTPTGTHANVVTAAAAAGKHVYCEKPMAPTIEEADAMIEACKTAGVFLMVAFMKRHNKSFQRAKEVIESGDLGDVFELRCTWDNGRAAATKGDYRHRAESGGGFLQEDGSHPLDVCRWWLGEVEEVTANALLVASDRLENEDVAGVMLRHKSGALSSLHITMLSHRRGLEAYEVFGTRGTLVLEAPYHSSRSLEPLRLHLYRKSTERVDLTLPASWNPGEEFESSWQYGRELEHFCECVAEGREPAVTGKDGRAVVEILNAAYASVAEGAKIKLPLAASPDLLALMRRLKAESSWALGDSTWWSWY